MPRPATTTPPSCLAITLVVASAPPSRSRCWPHCWRIPRPLNSDFMAFWSFPRFAASHPIRQIYNAASLQAFQKTLYPGFGSFYPYLYPPTFLLPSWWLNFCSFDCGFRGLDSLPACCCSASRPWRYFPATAGSSSWPCWPARPPCSTASPARPPISPPPCSSSASPPCRRAPSWPASPSACSPSNRNSACSSRSCCWRAATGRPSSPPASPPPR